MHTESGDDSTPERTLWRAVIEQAYFDARYGYGHWRTVANDIRSAHFDLICELADLNPELVRRAITNEIERRLRGAKADRRKSRWSKPAQCDAK